MIERNGKNLLRLINQLLDLSKLENNVFKLKLEQLDIVQHLEYLITNFKDYAKENGLELSFESSEQELWMDYDANQVKQILTNLISNAIKFTNPGGHIHISLTVANQQLHIQVKDTGIGIAKADQEKIFERFYQVDQGNTRVGEGTGIGLAHSHADNRMLALPERELGRHQCRQQQAERQQGRRQDKKSRCQPVSMLVFRCVHASPVRPTQHVKGAKKRLPAGSCRPAGLTMHNV